jgi:hypothetical protein
VGRDDALYRGSLSFSGRSKMEKATMLYGPEQVRTCFKKLGLNYDQYRSTMVRVMKDLTLSYEDRSLIRQLANLLQRMIGPLKEYDNWKITMRKRRLTLRVRMQHVSNLINIQKMELQRCLKCT